MSKLDGCPNFIELDFEEYAILSLFTLKNYKLIIALSDMKIPLSLSDTSEFSPINTLSVWKAPIISFFPMNM